MLFGFAHFRNIAPVDVDVVKLMHGDNCQFDNGVTGLKIYARFSPVFVAFQRNFHDALFHRLRLGINQIMESTRKLVCVEHFAIWIDPHDRATGFIRQSREPFNILMRAKSDLLFARRHDSTPLLMSSLGQYIPAFRAIWVGALTLQMSFVFLPYEKTLCFLDKYSTEWINC